MTLARSSLINLADTPYYHLVSRCVRRAYLCGSDSVSGQSFEHRRGWIINEINTLLRLFTLHISAYSIMENHYHLVVCIDKPAALALSDRQVALQWQQRFNLPVMVQRWLDDQPLSNSEQRLVKQFIKRWRARLYDISWFMRCLNESIARRANLEDKCKGRFWEGRFKSQALLDDKALLQCMAYVDLNPIRAALARTPETSRYTAIRQRIIAHQGQPLPKPAIALMPMGGMDTTGPAPSIPFKFEDYLNLVDWSGRAVREDKPGAIADDIPPILKRLQINPSQWINHTARSHHRFYRVIGTSKRIRELVTKLKQRSLFGIKANAEVFG